MASSAPADEAVAMELGWLLRDREARVAVSDRPAVPPGTRTIPCRGHPRARPWPYRASEIALCSSYQLPLPAGHPDKRMRQITAIG